MHNIYFKASFKRVALWPAKIKYLVGILLSSVFFVFGYDYGIEPQLLQSNLLLSQFSHLKILFEAKQQEVANLLLYKKNLTRLKGQFNQLVKQVSATNHVNKLLESIAQLGRTRGLSFELFEPLPDISRDFYKETPINITVTGHYHQMTSFLNQLALITPLITFNHFTMVKAKGKHPPDRLTLTIKAKIYHIGFS